MSCCLRSLDQRGAVAAPEVRSSRSLRRLCDFARTRMADNEALQASPFLFQTLDDFPELGRLANRVTLIIHFEPSFVNQKSRSRVVVVLFLDRDIDRSINSSIERTFLNSTVARCNARALVFLPAESPCRAIASQAGDSAGRNTSARALHRATVEFRKVR